MSRTAHLTGHTRWPGMPTSGRYVYKSPHGGWWWQCDLHDGDEALPGEYAPEPLPTMRDAFDAAMAHAATCAADPTRKDTPNE